MLMKSKLVHQYFPHWSTRLDISNQKGLREIGGWDVAARWPKRGEHGPKKQGKKTRIELKWRQREGVTLPAAHVGGEHEEYKDDEAVGRHEAHEAMQDGAYEGHLVPALQLPAQDQRRQKGREEEKRVDPEVGLSLEKECWRVTMQCSLVHSMESAV